MSAILGWYCRFIQGQNQKLQSNAVKRKEYPDLYNKLCADRLKVLYTYFFVLLYQS
jgi:hypothetical protein